MGKSNYYLKTNIRIKTIDRDNQVRSFHVNQIKSNPNNPNQIILLCFDPTFKIELPSDVDGVDDISYYPQCQIIIDLKESIL